ncbi:hypothetical protein V5N11_027381 [Cardamine amara subsp. amara]|uniref:F-box domain-containing protein n=1 Tax=Cardamine amara subsp. amara TaxID=228776 RepID=A0ABD1BJG9_CARAN
MASLRKRKRSKRALNWMKRRKVNDDDDACEARRKTNMIDDLLESLLSMEIFSKLSNPRDVIVCKSVSKRWNSLISSSSFHYNPSLALILNTHPHPRATNEISLEGWKGFELRKYIDPEVNSPVCVLASYRDVLLCMKYASSRCKTRSQFYIVNPVTMRWTRVPDSENALSTYPIGLSGNGSKGMYYVVMLIPFVED